MEITEVARRKRGQDDDVTRTGKSVPLEYRFMDPDAAQIQLFGGFKKM